MTEDYRKRGLKVPLSVIGQAKQYGLTMQELLDMVRLSARCTHELGNRRYEDYVFMVIGDRVTSIAEFEEAAPVDCSICKDTGIVHVFDQCEHCDGLGCNACNDGLVPSTVPCQQCELKKLLSATTLGPRR